MAKKSPVQTTPPELICLGVRTALAYGAGCTLHPAEMLGEDWLRSGDWGCEPDTARQKLRASQADAPPRQLRLCCNRRPFRGWVGLAFMGYK